MYGDVPPIGFAVALPLFPPLQVIFELTLAPADKASAGWVMVTLAVADELQLSVTVTV